MYQIIGMYQKHRLCTYYWRVARETRAGAEGGSDLAQCVIRNRWVGASVCVCPDEGGACV